MNAIIITLVCVITFLFVGRLVLHTGHIRDTAKDQEPSKGTTIPDMDCGKQPSECGTSCFCDAEAQLRKMKVQIEYYDDEELDAYRGMKPDCYTDDQIDVFSEIMSTMKPQEVAGWLRSLELRGIALPAKLRDEAILLMNG